MSSGELGDEELGDEELGQGADGATSTSETNGGAQMTPVARPDGSTSGGWMDKTAQKEPWKLILLGALGGLAVGAVGGMLGGMAMERARPSRGGGGARGASEAGAVDYRTARISM